MDSKIVVAQITKIEKHPNASKLKVCTVNDGAESSQVVCGAGNVKLNMLTILASPGAVLPSGKTIEPANLRGVDSHGMLCSALDLGIAQESGIIDLPPSTQTGISFKQIPLEQMSSIPWYQYKHIDNHWFIKKENRIIVSLEAPVPEALLVSQTYFDGANYQYRHFSEKFAQ